MEEGIKAELGSEKGAKACAVCIGKSLRAVGNSRISVERNENQILIRIEDDSPSKKKAARYGATRILSMVEEIDKAIK